MRSKFEDTYWKQRAEQAERENIELQTRARVLEHNLKQAEAAEEKQRLKKEYYHEEHAKEMIARTRAEAKVAKLEQEAEDERRETQANYEDMNEQLSNAEAKLKRHYEDINISEAALGISALYARLEDRAEQAEAKYKACHEEHVRCANDLAECRRVANAYTEQAEAKVAELEETNKTITNNAIDLLSDGCCDTHIASIKKLPFAEYVAMRGKMSCPLCTESQLAAAREVLQAILRKGYNPDCFLCGLKDQIAEQVLKEGK